MKAIGIGIIAFMLFWLQRKIYEKYWDKKLKVTVSFAQQGITQGQVGEVVEIIENRKRLPLNLLKVKFQTSRYLEFSDNPDARNMDQYYRNDLFQIRGGERITRRLKFVGIKRGYYHIRNIDLVASDLLLSHEMSKQMATQSYLYVYPKTFEGEEFTESLQKLNGEILVKRHLMEDPFEYRGIREYQPFDDIHSVNWKATARTAVLKVNQKNHTAMQIVRIFLNIEDTGILKRGDAVEASMQIAMGIASYFLAQGIKVACYGNGRDIISGEAVNISGGAGAGQLDAIRKALARIDTDQPVRSFAKLHEERLLKDTGNTVTMFVSPNGYDDFLELLGKCESAGMDYVWFYPYTGVRPKVPEGFKKHVRFLEFERS